MRVGIVGLAQSGKKTLFHLLTGAKAPASHGKGEFPVGVASVPDDRVDRLSALYKPKKTKYAEIELVLFPAMPHDAKARDKWFDAARQLDGMCFLVRAFTDPGVYHEEGSVDPARDLEKLDLEFTFADLALTETRLERLAKDTAKKTAAERGKQQELLGRFKAELEAGRWLRGMDLSDGDRARLGGLKFLTRIGTVIAVNADEDVPADAEKKRSLVVSLPARERRTVCVSAKFEAELAEIDDAAEREEFMSQFGVTESAAARLTRAMLEALDQASFLTVGPDEVRAWLVRRGATAPEAAGVVHTDFERGFIRAEVMDVDELLAAGSESRLRDKGKVALKGRDYVVRDGDIFHILAGT
jgi:GTP-binding protein YchF